MGKVRMTEYDSIPEFQETNEILYDYTYCDNCGSFNIVHLSRLPLVIDKGLIVFVLASYIAVFVLLFFNWHLSCLVSILGVSALIVTVSTAYRECAKCGNKHITSNNVLHYSQNDRSVIDVPESSIIKKQIKRPDHR